MLHHFVCWHVKHVERVPVCKSGHILQLRVSFYDFSNVISHAVSYTVLYYCINALQ